ncbi:MAG: EVE domain-containing protein [Bacteroidetes bacterium]|nr:EVE domain-containing protein [Rhodothermia bacterium]MCS7154394.1 EVE domain-containing protein [Bacteroidota bacterium]MCX7907639.1 EVE domain-containing protein [Bacteroidota bacterium]MDW8137768.1 EVE domain-containing protein [Bacteroidota bacterium]MDW8286381.1 EVE domain-containing protein [Bacteroidota bacterium]
MPFWLLKSEPQVYSIEDLERDGETLWDGVRNYQARNFLRQMRPGDRAFFYHSNAFPPGVAGLMRVVETEVPDPTQFEPESPYYDPKARPEAPRWWTVRVRFEARFSRYVSLEVLRRAFSPEELWILRRGNRLSVVPVSDAVAERLLKLGGIDGGA